MELSAKPALRGYLHEAAFFCFLGAGFMLVISAHTPLSRVASLIYALSLNCLFGASALYHRHQWGEQARQWLRRIDHSSIYLFIAGSGTPVILLGISDPSGVKLLWAVWVTSFFGTMKCFFWPTAPRLLNVILYIGTGLIAVPFMPELMKGVGPFNVGLLLIGGAIYSLGALVYFFRKPNPFPKTFGYHEVFHFMVVVAGIIHFKVIYDLVHRY